MPVKRTKTQPQAAFKAQPQHALPAGSAGKKAFGFLFLIAWACAAALLKWNVRWLYVPICLAAIAALWVGRRQPLLLRVLLLPVLLLPIWKEVDRSRHGSAAHTDAAAAANDAVVISALVR